MKPSAETVDTFVRDHLPPRDQWPDLLKSPDTDYPVRLNAATELVDATAEQDADRTAIRWPGGSWTYRDLAGTINRIANVLVHEHGLIPGNRVLLRAANNPMMVACYFAVLKAGGVAVGTMPLLRSRELVEIASKAQIRLALCDADLLDELAGAMKRGTMLEEVVTFSGDGTEEMELERAMGRASDQFAATDTAADDPALIAFTSGTTGKPKGTVHFQRDLLAICDLYSKHVLQPAPDDVFCGSPPLAFTFGLGGLALFPFRAGASTLLLEKPSPPALADAIHEFSPTICFTAPTAYRVLGQMAENGEADLSSLRKCVSAGEMLPIATFEAFKQTTGISIIDGIGATEMLHIFISSSGLDIRPGATGRPVPGYEARVVDDELNTLPAGEVGSLAVRGPTGCRYLDDERQRKYVRNGWNLTGDAYLIDEDGYFWFQARADDMIVSSGYNIGGPEVEQALLAHRDVEDCAVVGVPDENRGQIVKAFIILRDSAVASEEMVDTLQTFVKGEIAPYKYPRAIEFVSDLPRTDTGKIQRFKLRQGIQ
ncbi:MAG: AMP-binding protein [Pseudomonadota bacterium]